MNPEQRKVVVVGGGISGLTAAWRLHSAGHAVTLLEASPGAGGVLRTGELGGIRLDLGAESMLARRPEAVDLARELGLGEEIVHPVTTSSAVYSRGQVVPLPTGTLMGVPGDPTRLRPLLTQDEADRAAHETRSEPVEDDVDVASWVSARLGSAVVDRLVEPLLGGVYAGRADRISLRAAIPQLWPVAASGGSLLEAVAALTQGRPGTPAPGRPGTPAPVTPALVTPAPVFAGLRGGVGRLAETLAKKLGENVRTGVTVRGIERTEQGWRILTGPTTTPEYLDAHAVVLAVPPAAAARLLAGIAPDAAQVARAIRTASVGLVAALVPRASLGAVPGSGVLVPPVETQFTSGVKALTYSSAKWGWVGEQAPDDVAVIRLSLGRVGEEAVLQQDDDALARTALTGAEQLLGRPVPAKAWRVQRWGGGLPQYDVGHVDAVARVRASVAEVPGLAVCGAWLDGVGVPACVAAATRAAAEATRSLGAVPGTMEP